MPVFYSKRREQDIVQAATTAAIAALETRDAPEQAAQGSGVIPPPRTTTSITADSALSLSSVYRAVSILGTGAKQLSLDAWRGDAPIDRPALLRSPDVNSTLPAWLEENVTSLATRGNSYWRLTRNDRGAVTNAVVLDPTECNPDVDNQGRPLLSWRGIDLDHTQHRHLKLLRRAGQLEGLGPISACRIELAGVRDVATFGSNWFSTGDVPSGVLSTDAELTAAEADDYRTRWHNRESHEVAVLGRGLSYEPLLLSPEDALFVDVQKFSVTQVARLFGIPAHLLLATVDGSAMTYQNVASADLAFVRWSLMAYLSEIETALSACLPNGQTAKFNLDAILRADTTTRYAAHATAITAGWMKRSEVRSIEGLPAIDGIDDAAIPTPTPEQDAA